MKGPFGLSSRHLDTVLLRVHFSLMEGSLCEGMDCWMMRWRTMQTVRCNTAVLKHAPQTRTWSWTNQELP